MSTAPAELLTDPDVIVRVASDAESRRRIRREVEGRRWAHAQGIPTPDILGFDAYGGWVASRLVRAVPSAGIDYVARGLDLAERLSELTPPQWRTPGSTWQASRSTLALRVARLALAGVDPLEFRRTRAAAAALPAVRTGHGDFHDANLMNVPDHDPAAIDGLVVIDWEHAGPGARHADAVRLLTTLDDPADTAGGLELLLGRTPRAEHAGIGTLYCWLSLRHYADHISQPTRPHPPELLASLRRRWREAVEVSRELG